VAARPAGRLLIKSTRGAWEVKIENDMPCRIGRRDPSQSHYPEIDLAEHDRGIASRHHATIQRDDNVYALTDLGSTNGTFVNGNRIAAFSPQPLRPGDVIKVGEVEMEFRWA
jgi:pSer/pThr/pTyr-binding forkhead associated (FHA) protein